MKKNYLFIIVSILFGIGMLLFTSEKVLFGISFFISLIILSILEVMSSKMRRKRIDELDKSGKTREDKNELKRISEEENRALFDNKVCRSAIATGFILGLYLILILYSYNRIPEVIESTLKWFFSLSLVKEFKSKQEIIELFSDPENLLFLFAIFIYPTSKEHWYNKLWNKVWKIATNNDYLNPLYVIKSVSTVLLIISIGSLFFPNNVFIVFLETKPVFLLLVSTISLKRCNFLLGKSYKWRDIWKKFNELRSTWKFRKLNISKGVIDISIPILILIAIYCLGNELVIEYFTVSLATFSAYAFVAIGKNVVLYFRKKNKS